MTDKERLKNLVGVALGSGLVSVTVSYQNGVFVADPYISFIWGRNWVELQDGQVK